MRKIFLSVLFVLLLFTVPCNLSPVFAAEEFATSYDVTYEVGNDGITTVTQKISLKNLTSQYYASQFSLTIGATQISDVSASDASGEMEVRQEQKGTSTSLNVKFNQQVAGQGKILPWTLTFKSKDFASKQGKVWEVSVPKVVSSSNLESYNLLLVIPEDFGSPTSISPTPKKQTSSFGKQFLSFDKEQLQNSGVSANFGTNQIFDFDLVYHLENPNLVPVLTSIALPPDTAYQDVIYQRIDPKPVNVTVDNDGNYLAWYRLKRSEKMDIKVIGSAKLYINSKVKNPVLDQLLRQKYTAADKYWDKDHPAIKVKLSEILGSNPPNSNSEKAKLINRYIVNNLKYDSSRLSETNIDSGKTGVDRLGAVTALNNPSSAICMEFTDLFIALTRAAGIPARELNGYAYTANPNLRPLSLSRDILHAWPEYFDDDKGWVMIDPTWENTTGGVDYFNKFDLNHFVFAVKGLSSQSPAPAGSYKYDGQDGKDVNVTFSENDFLGKSHLNVSIEVPDPVISGLPGKLKLKITNLGNALQPSSALSVKADKLNIIDSTNHSLGPIPAFGYGEFEYDLRAKSLLDSYDDTITVTVAGQTYTKTVLVRPFIIFRSFPFVIIALALVILAIYFSVLGGFIYRRRFLKKKDSKK